MEFALFKALLPSLFAIALGSAVHGQTILSRLLEDLSRYISAAAQLSTNAIAGIEKVNAAQIPNSEDRQQAAKELRQISGALSGLRVSQTPLVTDLSSYVKDVRKQGFNEKHRREWNSIVSSVQLVSRVVSTTFQVVESSKWLKVALSEQDRLTLREALLGRVALLDRLKGLSPPIASEEIEQLDRMGVHYRRLMASLNELNIALLRAIDRLE